MMSWCISRWTLKSLSSLCVAVPLGIAVAFTLAEQPAKAQFADTPSTSQPSQPPQEQTSQTSNVQVDEGIQNLDWATSIVMANRGTAWASAQFIPTPKPSDSDNPLPTTAS